MISSCAWCDKETRERCEAFGIAPIEESGSEPVTHGICDNHYKGIMASLDEARTGEHYVKS